MRTKIFLVMAVICCHYLNSFAGGFIIMNNAVTVTNANLRTTPKVQDFTLRCKKLRIDVQMDGPMAITTVEQTFENGTGQRLEGDYFFPLPKNAVIKEFRMEMNGEMVKAEMLDAQKARQIYEDIVRQMKDPALLEFSDQGMLRMRIFPIEPNSTKEIKLVFAHYMPTDNGTYEYVYPLNALKYNSHPIEDVVMNVDIKANEKIRNVYSPTHLVDVVHNSDFKAHASMELGKDEMPSQFKLYYSTSSSLLGLSMFQFKEKNEDGFFIADISPGFIDQNKVVSKDVTFIMDISGSMRGDKIIQARNTLSKCVEQLNPGDKFEIITFGTEAYQLFGKRTIVDETSKKKAYEFINRIEPLGGTNMDAAFGLAMQEKVDITRPSNIIFITDGRPTIGEYDEAKLMKKISSTNAKSHRIFTFGVGEDLNIKLLDLIAADGRGLRAYISEGDDISKTVTSFFKKISAPVLSDVKISFADAPNEYQVFPKNCPDIFYGSSLTVSGRFRNPGNTKLIVEGMLNGVPQKFEYDVAFKEEAAEQEFVPAIWASRRVGDLLDQIRLTGENAEIKDEIVTLSRRYGIITPYTSYLILEDERAHANVRGGDVEENQTIFNPNATNTGGVAMQKEYDDLKKDNGYGAQEKSTEIQQLNTSSNISDTKLANKRMKVMEGESDNKPQNIVCDNTIANGRAMYQTDSMMVDADVMLDKNSKLKKKEIKFASEEYFNLANTDKAAREYMSKGRNVQFVHNNQVYVVTD
jgi:Ca-activated chloride channel family protein